MILYNFLSNILLLLFLLIFSIFDLKLRKIPNTIIIIGFISSLIIRLWPGYQFQLNLQFVFFLILLFGINVIFLVKRMEGAGDFKLQLFICFVIQPFNRTFAYASILSLIPDYVQIFLFVFWVLMIVFLYNHFLGKHLNFVPFAPICLLGTLFSFIF